MPANYIVASSKPWNRQLATRLAKRIEGKWMQLGRVQELNFANLSRIKPRYVFIPHWSHIIPADVYENFECVVFHMTDLPYGRGGSPLQNLIVRDHIHTVISALRVQKGLDTGPIYLKHPLDLSGTAQEIFERADAVIEEMIVQIVTQNVEPTPQEGEPVIFARRKPEQSNIQGINDLRHLYNHIRMLDAEGYPHAFLETDNFKLEFKGAIFADDGSLQADVRITTKPTTTLERHD